MTDGDKHQTLTANEFNAELEKQDTLELTSSLLLTSDGNKQLAILRVQGLQATRHQKFGARTPGELQVFAERSDLVSMLTGCLRHLEATPEHRIADSLEQIETILAQK